MQRFLALTLLCTVFTFSSVLGAERIVLKSGCVIEAQSYTQSELGLTIELGFETLFVPQAEIERIDSLEPADQIRLFHESDSGVEAALDENIETVGEAVVLVRTPVGLGSGFMIHPEGYLITNDHVIEGSTELTIVVYRQATDGLRKDEYKNIRIVASSALLDLALLKIEPEEPEEFVTVPLANSNKLNQGQAVFAVGNPLGLERSLSEGIVALKSRLLSGQTYVQTTTALSPGNSGGPLFNMAGEVIGVNSLKVVAQGAEGLSFCIPINKVKAFIDDQEAYAFDTLNSNSGHRYYSPPKHNER
ncbi:MAG: serine protease Do [Pseudohongiellaceae bacterium]|jgi:serine protease Do